MMEPVYIKEINNTETTEPIQQISSGTDEEPWRICGCGLEFFKSAQFWSQRWAAHTRNCSGRIKRKTPVYVKKKKHPFGIKNHSSRNPSKKQKRSIPKNVVRCSTKVPKFNCIEKIKNCTICENTEFNSHLIQCATCKKQVHWFCSGAPISIMINKELGNKWECPSCDTCKVCDISSSGEIRNDELLSTEHDCNHTGKSMNHCKRSTCLTCSICDRTEFHITCFENPQDIPDNYICKECITCAVCGKPRENFSNAGCEPNLCNSCINQFKEEERCTYCKKTPNVSIPMIKCKECGISFHNSCAGLTEESLHHLQDSKCLTCILKGSFCSTETIKLEYKNRAEQFANTTIKEKRKIIEDGSKDTPTNCLFWCCREPNCTEVFQSEFARLNHEAFHSYFESFKTTKTLDILIDVPLEQTLTQTNDEHNT